MHFISVVDQVVAVDKWYLRNYMRNLASRGLVVEVVAGTEAVVLSKTMVEDAVISTQLYLGTATSRVILNLSALPFKRIL